MPDEKVPPVDDKVDKKDDLIDDEDDKDQNKDDLTPEEVASAKSLFKALKDPETAQELIETLAKKAGVLDRKGEPTESKKDVKKELGRITKKLKGSLGKDFDKFSDLVGPALDEAIEEILSEKFGERDSRNTATTWEEAVDNFTETHEITPKIQAKIKELMDEAPPNLAKKGFDGKRYLDRMWKLAHQELSLDIPRRTRKPIEDDEDSDTFQIREKKVNRDLSLDEAVELALKGIKVRR